MTSEKTLRVGIPIIGYKSWMGGVCYIELLVKALCALQEPERPELFLIVTDDSLPRLELHESILHLFKEIVFVGDQRPEDPNLGYAASHRELLETLDFYFPVMNGAWPTAKAASWIPDFQHLHLPQFFHEEEQQYRSQNFAAIAAQAKLLVFSSQDAQNDFERFYPGSEAVTRVLSFYALPHDGWYSADCTKVQARYGLPDAFLICCNQFWTHKNHGMLFQAIAQLHAGGIDVHLVCTGPTEDYRTPGYFDAIKELVATLGVGHLIHILGSIPRQDQIQLVRRAMALVQPSLFEGWSTVIEDCRVLGKTMLLSDLPVHREQAPRFGVYFDRSRLESLTGALRALLPRLAPGPDAAQERQARDEAPALVHAFARRFCSIARQARELAAQPPQQQEPSQQPSHQLPPRLPVPGAPAPGQNLPRISIVTPSLNQAGHLEECIRSVLSQGYPNLEYIIMDGGSTDGSLDIIRKYQGQLAYWQSCPDGGQYCAINEGFRRSTGEIMGWLNSDDMLHPGGLQVIADVFNGRPQVEFLTGKRVGFDGAGQLNSYGFETQTWSREHLLDKKLIHQLSLFVMQEATYWRRSLWEKAGAALDPGLKLAADFDLWLRFSRHAQLHTVDALTGGFRYYSDGQRCNRFRDAYVAECDAVIDRELLLGATGAPSGPPPPLIPYPLVGVKPQLLIRSRELPKITIVTPSYNQAAFLEECIDSVLSQNYPGLEYIVMDGGSSDGSPEIIRKHQKHLSHWQSAPDGGQYPAVNDGFRRSGGAIMAWLNSDDKYHPGALWLVSDAFRAFPQVSWITGSPTGWDECGRPQYFSSQPPLWSREKYLRGEIGPPHIQQESTFWRRSLWDLAGGGLDTGLDFAADLELWARFFRHAQLHTLDAPLGGFRSHPAQKTASFLEQYHGEAARVIERERLFFTSSGAPALEPPPQPLSVAEVAQGAGSSVTPENFGTFTYSRRFHFAYFAGGDLDLYGEPINPEQCDLKGYQDLLAYSFIRKNIRPGARVLEIGGGNSRVLRAIGSDYECWNLDKLEGVGNGPVRIDTTGFRLVQDYIGAFSADLPQGYFDLVFSISVLEHVEQTEENFAAICRDIARVLKPGGWSLHCLDVVARGRQTFSNALLPYIFRQIETVNPWVPFEQLYLDPYVYAMSEQAYDRIWKPTTRIPFREHGFPLSYNVLWKNGESGRLALPPGECQSYRVSAIVSTYNAERFFRGCLDNLLSQTLYLRGELEIIIVNSGSLQDEEGIAREYLARHDHIVYLRTGHETLYAAWNRGIALARGRYLTHANTDDRHRGDAFELMAHALERHEVGLVYCDALMTCGENETFRRNSAGKSWLLPDFNLRQALLDCPFGCQVMWRAAAHAEVGHFDASYRRAGDYEFFLRLALRQGALHLPEILVLYHESLNNLSYQAPHEVIREVHRFIGRQRKTIPLAEIYPYLTRDSSAAAQVTALLDFANHIMGASASLFTDTPLAEMLYRKALELAPGHPEVIGNLAVASIVQGKLPDAIAIIGSASVQTERLKGYLSLLSRGVTPELTLTGIGHPGLSAMPPVKLLEQIRVPRQAGTAAPQAEIPRAPLRENASGFPKVVIDGVFFMTGKTGITRVWLALLCEWARSEFGASLVVLDRIGTAPRIPGLRYRMVPGYDVHPPGWDRTMLQQVCDEEGADLFISTYYSTPLTTPSLFLSHDMIPELSGHYNLQDAQWREKRHALGRASAFVSVSCSTARDMARLHPELSGRITVAHCGIDRGLFYPSSATEADRFRKRHQIATPFFLFIGKRSEHKNGELLFRAFSRLPERERFSIVCVGGSAELEPELAALVERRAVRIVNLDDQELRSAYSCAVALVFPSTYEGFGLPLLEAMACHCPVITCQNSSIAEVAGAAACYVAPDAPEELIAAMHQVQMPEVRAQLIKMGSRRAEKFSWGKMADTLQGVICDGFAPSQPELPAQAQCGGAR